MPNVRRSDRVLTEVGARWRPEVLPLLESFARIPNLSPGFDPGWEGDRLYARGVADDGYSLPSALVAIESVIGAGGRHGRCIVLAEGSEESGSGRRGRGSRRRPGRGGARCRPLPGGRRPRPPRDSNADRALRTAWPGAVVAPVVGADGLPPTQGAGAVLRPATAVTLVVRFPPTCGGEAAALDRALTHDPANGATVKWTPDQAATGWAAPPFTTWLTDAIDDASSTCFGRPFGRFGEGGTIPFLGWLAARFTGAQILAAGVLGPGSNTHGPDESLHLSTAERVTASLAVVLDAHARRPTA